MFGRRFDLFRVQGVTIGIDASWIVIAVLVTWSLAVGVFPAMVPARSPATYWVMGAAGALGLFGAIVVHELAHAIVARRLGIPIRGITLFIFGGVAALEGEPPDARSELRMAAAGPLTSFAIAALCAVVAALGRSAWPRPVTAVLSYLATINLVLAVFNLIPAFPLDGGRILRAALWQRRGDLRRATELASRIGAGFGMFLIILGVLRLILGDVVGGIWSALIGLFLRSAAAASYQQIIVREALQGEPVRRFMNTSPVVVSPRLSVAQLVDEYIYRHHHTFFPVVEDDRLVGCVAMRDIKAVPRSEWETRTVGAVATHCTPETTVAPDAEAAEALAKMNRTGASRLLVVDGERLLGLLTLKDLMAFLALKLELEPERR